MANIEFMRKHEVEKYLQKNYKDISDAFKEQLNKWFDTHERDFHALVVASRKNRDEMNYLRKPFKLRYGLNTFMITIYGKYMTRDFMDTKAALFFVRWHTKLYVVVGFLLEHVTLVKITQHFLERFKERSPYKGKINDENILVYLTKEFHAGFNFQSTEIPEKIIGYYGLAILDPKEKLLMTYIGKPNMGQKADRLISMSKSEKAINEYRLKKVAQKTEKKIQEVVGSQPLYPNKTGKKLSPIDFSPKPLTEEMKNALDWKPLTDKDRNRIRAKLIRDQKRKKNGNC